jgi:LmbE family N-acetylglucosaminyl deacetylase
MCSKLPEESRMKDPQRRGFRLPAFLLAAVFALTAAAGHGAPQAWTLPLAAAPSRADRILIVAPHIDDEAIGAAGFVSAARTAGAEIYVVYLTAGDCNRTSARMMGRTLRPKAAVFLEVGERRYGEALEAMSRLGIARSHTFLLGYPDRGLGSMLDAPDSLVRSPGTGQTAVPYTVAVSPGAEYRLANVLRDMERVLQASRPTAVILPVPFDQHRDHSAGTEITLRALAASSQTPRLLGYLVHAHRFPAPFLPASARSLLPPPAFARQPWTVFPLTREQVAQKKRVLQAYRSQRRDPYLYLLTGAFVRRNELFLPLPVHAAAVASR